MYRFSNILYSLCLFFAMASIYADWEFHKQYGQTSIYKSPQGSRLVLEGKKTKLKKEKKFNKQLLDELQASKKKLLNLVGVEDWQVTERKIKKEKVLTELNFSGNYLNRKGERVYFHEKHIYRKAFKLQLLLTNSDQGKLKRDVEGEELAKVWRKYDSK